MNRTLATLSLALTTTLIVPSMAAAATAEGEWQTYGQGLSSAIDSVAYDVVKGPDGNVYATGCFDNAGGVAAADVIAMWNGTSWVALGNNGDGDGFFSQGCGWSIAWNSDGDLIVGGDMRAHTDSQDQSLFMWDGATWSNLGQNLLSSGDSDGGIRDVEVDSLDNIYIGGPFTNVGGDANIDYLAKLSGGVFSALGDDGASGRAITGHVSAIEIDSADNVYVGGKFENAGGLVEADAVAKWNGSAWSSLDSDGSGNGYFFKDSSTDVINDIIMVGSTLYVASNNWDTPATEGGDGYGIYAFDGTDFEPLFNVTWLGDYVRALDYNPDTNSLLIAGWFEDFAGDDYGDGLVSYDLDTDIWNAFGATGSDGADFDADGFTVAYLGSGDIAYGGWFDALEGNTVMEHFGIWDNGSEAWQPAGSSPNGAFNSELYDVAVGPDGNIYATGCFTDASTDPTADIVAMWDGDSWVGLGDDGLGNGFFVEAVDGCGFALDWMSNGDLVLAGRNLISSGESQIQSLYSWDGANWTNLAYDKLMNNSGLRDIHVNSDDSIYLAGPLTNMDGDADIDYIALWDNGTISAVGDDGSGGPSLNNHALNLEVDDAGNLYVSGKFTNAGGVAEADKVAMWDGTSWTALGSNGSGDGYFAGSGSGAQVHAMEWVNGTLYLGANEVDTPTTTDIFGVFAFADGEIQPVLDITLIGDDIRDFGYDNESNRLIVAGWFQNVNEDPLADGIIGIDLDDDTIYTYGETFYGSDIEADGADRDADGNSVEFIGDGDILYSGSFDDFNDDGLADNFAFWDGPAAGLAATGVEQSTLGYLAVAAAIAAAGGLVLRRRV